MKKRIGAVARALGLSAKTIRYYEQIGLVPPPHREGTGWFAAGQRMYEEPEMERLRFVKEARHRDFAIEDIRQLLAGYENGPACGCGARPLLRSMVERKLREIDGAIIDLQTLRSEMQILHARTVALENKTPKELLKAGTPTLTEAMFGTTPSSERDTPDDLKNKH